MLISTTKAPVIKIRPGKLSETGISPGQKSLTLRDLWGTLNQYNCQTVGIFICETARQPKDFNQSFRHHPMKISPFFRSENIGIDPSQLAYAPWDQCN